MSKEEMIKAISKGVFPSGHENHSSYAKGYNAAIEETVELLESHLDTYAQEIAVGLLEWVRANGIYPVGEMWNFRREYITTPLLFQQFLTNKNEKK